MQEIEHGIHAKISRNLSYNSQSTLDETIHNQIVDAEIFIIFISNASKKSDFIRQCASLASNLNKNILPVEIDKQGIFRGKYPQEFKFRSKPYEYYEPEAKGALLAQLKASLGINVEEGDLLGALIHIITDRDIRITRYGKEICVAHPNTDNRIRLKKGTHQLRIEDKGNSNLFILKDVEITDIESEQYIDISMTQDDDGSNKRNSTFIWILISIFALIITAGIILFFYFQSKNIPYSGEARAEPVYDGEYKNGNYYSTDTTETNYSTDQEEARELDSYIDNWELRGGNFYVSPWLANDDGAYYCYVRIWLSEGHIDIEFSEGLESNAEIYIEHDDYSHYLSGSRNGDTLTITNTEEISTLLSFMDIGNFILRYTFLEEGASHWGWYVFPISSQLRDATIAYITINSK